MAKTSTATEAGQEGSLREGLEAAIRERVREVIELILEEEVEGALGASRSQRVAERSGYRHGAKPRRLTLRTGRMALRVPRARLVSPDGAEREWQSGLVPRYRRSSAEVEQSVLGVYLAGSNTRRIRGALEPLLDGAALSKSAVSRLVLRLEESYRAWQRRDLAEEKIVYLYLDAIYPKVRSGGKVVSLAVLVALGVRENGEKVLLSLMTAGAESTGGWQMLLEDLAGRKMGRPRLVISDGNPGLGTALGRLWPGVAHQRCTVHKLRNLMAKAPKHTHEAVREDYHRIVYAANREAAEEAREAFLGKWKKLCPGVATSLEEAGEELLTFFGFPESQHLSLRTTNAIERMQLEFRRRVKTQAALPSEDAVLRLFFGLWVSGQIKLRRIRGYRDIGGQQEEAA
jgi:putative transposase